MPLTPVDPQVTPQRPPEFITTGMLVDLKFSLNTVRRYNIDVVLTLSLFSSPPSSSTYEKNSPLTFDPGLVTP